MDSDHLQAKRKRNSPVGAELVEGAGVHFRVWAPGHAQVLLLLQGREPVAMTAEPAGYWSCLINDAAAGDRYRIRLSHGEERCEECPDPASRFQPHGPHGPSEVIDASAYAWSAAEARWPGKTLEAQVLYELHIGTLTPEGTYEAAERELARLAALGITVLEVMPLAEFSGHWGWGYDGVDLFAPFHRYGTPDALRHFIDAAHQAGLGVILDVVYNHLGPDGNYLRKFTDAYFAETPTEWGDAFNCDGADCQPVRDFFKANAAYWIREFHFDGLRLDATQAIQDNLSQGKHILEEIGEAARAAAGGRPIIIVAENEPQNMTLIRPIAEGGYGLDGLWNDDLHHSMMVRLTLKREAYYSGHLGRAQEFVSAARYGPLYQGQYYTWQGAARGTPALGIAPHRFITFIENHDQVANTDTGSRVRQRSHPGVYRAMTAYWLLNPGTPMFFQGQEYGATTRFLYFADHQEKLGVAVREGRAIFLRQFPSLQSEVSQGLIPDASSHHTFEVCKLDPADQGKHGHILALHRDLLHLRRTDPVLARQHAAPDGAALTDDCFVLRYFSPEGDRLLVVNFGCDLDVHHAPEPLLAPLRGQSWSMAWSSDEPRYGGGGTVVPWTEKGWRIPGAAAMLLFPVPQTGA